MGERGWAKNGGTEREVRRLGVRLAWTRMVIVVVMKMQTSRQTQEIFKTILLMGFGDGLDTEHEWKGDVSDNSKFLTWVTGWETTPFPELRSAERGLRRKDHEFTFGPVEFAVPLRYLSAQVKQAIGWTFWSSERKSGLVAKCRKYSKLGLYRYQERKSCYGRTSRMLRVQARGFSSSVVIFPYNYIMLSDLSALSDQWYNLNIMTPHWEWLSTFYSWGNWCSGSQVWEPMSGLTLLFISPIPSFL